MPSALLSGRRLFGRGNIDWDFFNQRSVAHGGADDVTADSSTQGPGAGRIAPLATEPPGIADRRRSCNAGPLL